jgi:hypothetical protein
MVRDGLLVSSLAPDERKCFIIILSLCSFWDRIMIFRLLHPMTGHQEAHLQIRYILAVWDFDEVHPSFIIFDMKLECACVLDVLPSFYPFHFCVVLFTLQLDVLKLVWVVSQCD